MKRGTSLIQSIDQLKETATVLRKRILSTAYYKKQGHVGGSLSCADILVSLFFHQLSIDPSNPRWEDRDRFVLSKGSYGIGALCNSSTERIHFRRRA